MIPASGRYGGNTDLILNAAPCVTVFYYRHGSRGQFAKNEPIRPRERLIQWWRVARFVRVFIVRTAAYQDRRLGLALGINVGVYAGIVACFAGGLYWLMQPTVVKNHGLAAYKPPPGAVVTYADTARLPTRAPPALPEPPETVGLADDPAPVVAQSTVAAPKKETKKRDTRTMPARDRGNPFWDNAGAPSRGYRPWDSAAAPSRGYRPWF